MWVKDIEQCDDLPRSIGIRREAKIRDSRGWLKLYKRNEYYKRVKAVDKDVYYLALQILENYTGRKFDDAYSEYSKLVPNHYYRQVFWNLIDRRERDRWNDYYISNGIIRKHKINPRFKRTAYTYYPFDFKEVLIGLECDKRRYFGAMSYNLLYNSDSILRNNYRYLITLPADSSTKSVRFNNRSRKYKRLQAENRQKLFKIIRNNLKVLKKQEDINLQNILILKKRNEELSDYCH